MSNPSLKLAAIVLGLCAVPLTLLVHAEDTAAPATETPVAEAAPADSAAAAASAEAPAAEAVAKPVAPRASEPAVKAASNPLLKVVNTGKQFVAVGARGHILLSSDGKEWKQVQTPVDVLLTSVAFADAEHGWAVGHDAVILATTDGGQTWAVQNFQPDLNKPLFDVLFLDASTGYAVGAYGLFLETKDAGATWTQIAVNPVTEGERHINAMTKLGNGGLMVVGEAGLIGVSPDGGTTWEKVASPYESSLFCVIAAGDSGALIGGLRGNSFFNNDVRAGTWNKIETKTDQSLFGMTALPGDRIAMVGLNSTLLIFSGSGPVRQVPITDQSGNKKTDTLSWVTAARDGSIILVGDAGVQRLDATAQ
ncbi:MAG TPA: YCF48-related protein [Nevskia sp.]|nr:YCF48-related protein [Nevskia sp.]